MIGRYGLDKRRIKKIIYDKIREDPDLFYYIDNHKIEKLTNLLVEGVSEAIEKNNKELIENIGRDIKY